MSRSDSSSSSSQSSEHDALPLPIVRSTSPTLRTGREEEEEETALLGHDDVSVGEPGQRTGREEEEKETALLGHDDVSVGEPGQRTDVKGLSKILNWNWRNILTYVTLCFVYLTVSATYSVIEPFFPNEAAIRGANSVVTGVIVSTAALCVVILSPIVGYFLPRLGVRFTLLSGLLLVGGAYVLLGFTYLMPSGWVFIMMCILLRLTEGVGSAMFNTAVIAIPPQLFPESVATVTGLMEIAAGIGFAFGPPIGGVLYAAGGFGLPFWLFGGLSLLFVPLCFLTVKVSSCEKFTMDLQALRKLSTDFPFYAILFGALILMAALSFPSPVLQPYLSSEFGLNQEKVGLVFLVGPLVYLILSFFIGPIADKLGPRYLIIAGYLLNGFGFFFFGPSKFISTPKLWLVIVGYAIIGIGIAMAIVPIFADALSIAKKHNPDTDVTGLVSGLLNSCYYAGLFIGPLVGGALYQAVGFQTSATICGELMLAEGFLLLGITLIDGLRRRYSS